MDSTAPARRSHLFNSERNTPPENANQSSLHFGDIDPSRTDASRTDASNTNLINLDLEAQLVNQQHRSSASANTTMRQAASLSNSPLPMCRAMNQSPSDSDAHHSHSPYHNFPQSARALIRFCQQSDPTKTVDLCEQRIPVEAIRHYGDKARGRLYSSVRRTRSAPMLPPLKVNLDSLLDEIMLEPNNQAINHLRALPDATRLRQGKVTFCNSMGAIEPKQLTTWIEGLIDARRSLNEIWHFCQSYFDQTCSDKSKEQKVAFFQEHFMPFVTMYNLHEQFPQDTDLANDVFFSPADPPAAGPSPVVTFDIGVRDQLKNLNEFLKLLQQTDEAVSPATKDQLVFRVHEVLRACLQSDEVLNKIVDLSMNNQTDCVDRRTLIFGDMEVEAFLHNHCQGKTTDKGLFDAGMRLLRLSIIDEYGIARARSLFRRPEPPFSLQPGARDESLTVVAAYRAAFIDLDLPVGTSKLRHTQIVIIDNEEINSIKRDVLHKTHDSTAVSHYFSQWTPWLEHIEKTDSEVIEAINNSALNKQSDLDDQAGIGPWAEQNSVSTLKEQQFREQADALRACRDIKIRSVVQAESNYRLQQLHQNWLVDQPALPAQMVEAEDAPEDVYEDANEDANEDASMEEQSHAHNPVSRQNEQSNSNNRPRAYTYANTANEYRSFSSPWG